ncbi:unnamed protein product [marine sediment metagenome]|uniref:N-acetyltransferase domain-containing protein n=1 Tax=marine sediment metagenome TaxID=412755 RepID=X0TC84_9ZZZZ
MENSPYGPENRHSIVQFYTEESQRGKGHAVALLSKVLEEYPSNVGGQTSSAVALRILWKKGFRPYDKSIKTLKGAEKERRRLSSVYMIRD